jgi:hypothetical protein
MRAARLGAADEILAESFASWTVADLHDLAELLERVARDFARPPRALGARRSTG